MSKKAYKVLALAYKPIETPLAFAVSAIKKQQLIEARLLGYKKCNLIRVPIADQYKLILSDLFPEYICGDCEPAPEDETISVRMYGNRPNSESGIIMQHMEARDSSLKFQGNEIFLAII